MLDTTGGSPCWTSSISSRSARGFAIDLRAPWAFSAERRTSGSKIAAGPASRASGSGAIAAGGEGASDPSGHWRRAARRRNRIEGETSAGRGRR